MLSDPSRIKFPSVPGFYTDSVEWFPFECGKAIGLASTTLHDWLKIPRHFFTQSEVKPKPMAIHSQSFSRAVRQLHVITSSFDWFTVLCMSFVIGQSDYFGFGFMSLLSHLETALKQKLIVQLIETIFYFWLLTCTGLTFVFLLCP